MKKRILNDMRTCISGKEVRLMFCSVKCKREYNECYSGETVEQARERKLLNKLKKNDNNKHKKSIS